MDAERAHWREVTFRRVVDVMGVLLVEARLTPHALRAVATPSCTHQDCRNSADLSSPTDFGANNCDGGRDGALRYPVGIGRNPLRHNTMRNTVEAEP